jgi:hypothetical protein
MSFLAIALEGGFDDDHVVVRVNGHLVLDEEHVSTRYQIGVARRFEVPITADDLRIEVRLPDRGLTGGTVVDGNRFPSLRVSVENGEMVFRPTRGPLHYA